MLTNIESSNPLQDFGVNMLTGEACAFSMRVLCDLNEDGASLIRDFLGLGHGTTREVFAENWNSTVGDSPAIASVMLTREVIPALIRFAMFRQGYQFFLTFNESWGGIAFDSEDATGNNSMLQLYIDGTAAMLANDKARLYRNPRGNHPRVGSRNVHAFTGRAD